jgi:hypothetical protein
MKFKKDDFVTFKEEGVYIILSQVPGSRTLFEIEDVDRGKGWDKTTESYKGITHKRKDEKDVIIGGGWERGENQCYGEKLIVHKKHLNSIIWTEKKNQLN